MKIVKKLFRGKKKIKKINKNQEKKYLISHNCLRSDKKSLLEGKYHNKTDAEYFHSTHSCQYTPLRTPQTRVNSYKLTYHVT